MLPQALEGGCATVWRDRLYVAGAVDTLGRPFVMQGPLTSDGLEAVIYRYTNPGFTYPSPACEAWNGYVHVVGEYAGPNAGVARFAVPEPPPINYIYEPIAPLSPALQRSGTRLAVWKGRLYIVGGLPDGAPEPDDRISMMTLEGPGFDGGVGSTTSLPEPLYHAGVAAHADTLYVVGGITVGSRASVHTWAAPINADGSLGAFGATRQLPRSSRTAAAIARDGFLYVVEGKGSTPFGVWAAPILAPGQLGEWRLMASYSPGRTGVWWLKAKAASSSWVGTRA
ncbi:MAG: hypothetical protein IPJ65_31040 [Archangiaceae bacterium]|nr:hypothetical protein [Archangiaceae bacterium]